jgi:hypothetical protein
VVLNEGRYDLEGGYIRGSSGISNNTSKIASSNTSGSGRHNVSASGESDLTKEAQPPIEVQTDGRGASVARPMDIVCECVATDAGGVKELAPFLCRFIFVQCKQHSRDYGVMHALLRLTSALMENSTINIKPWLHQVCVYLYTHNIDSLDSHITIHIFDYVYLFNIDPTVAIYMLFGCKSGF